MLASALLVLAASPELSPAPPCRNREDVDRPFATCFDPWRGVELFAGGRGRADGLVFTVSAAWRLRKTRESVSKTDSVWLGVQRLGAVEWAPLAQRLDATAWDIVYRRHASETGITLPGFPEARLPFPFDVGFAGHLAHFELNARPSERWSLETVSVALLFDPLRTTTGRVQLSLGPSASHRVTALIDGSFVHQFSPFTSGELFTNLETADGLFFARGGAIGGAVLELEGARTTWRPLLRGNAELGWVPLALNDQPLVLALRGDGTWRGDSSAEWSASLVAGVRFGSRHD